MFNNREEYRKYRWIDTKKEFEKYVWSTIPKDSIRRRYFFGGRAYIFEEKCCVIYDISKLIRKNKELYKKNIKEKIYIEEFNKEVLLVYEELLENSMLEDYSVSMYYFYMLYMKVRYFYDLNPVGDRCSRFFYHTLLIKGDYFDYFISYNKIFSFYEINIKSRTTFYSILDGYNRDVIIFNSKVYVSCIEEILSLLKYKPDDLLSFCIKNCFLYITHNDTITTIKRRLDTTIDDLLDGVFDNIWKNKHNIDWSKL